MISSCLVSERNSRKEFHRVSPEQIRCEGKSRRPCLSDARRLPCCCVSTRLVEATLHEVNTLCPRLVTGACSDDDSGLERRPQSGENHRSEQRVRLLLHRAKHGAVAVKLH